MSVIRFGFAQRLALELEARSWAVGRGLSTRAREEEAWRDLASQITRLEDEIQRLRLASEESK